MTTAISVPSIGTSAMLAELSISVWTGRKLDKEASRGVTLSHNASAGMANVNKKLLGDCQELIAVSKFVAQVRATHYAMTMPWSDSGLRLLPTTQYFKYNERMGELHGQYNDLVHTFLDAYEWEIQRAQINLGDLFNRDEYPSRGKLETRFGFNVCYIPLADAGDWRIDINKEAKDQLAEHYESYYTEQLNKAMLDVWNRTYEALARMSERLDYDKTKKVFRDTLVTNVTDIIDLLEVCNVTKDPAMTRAHEELRDALYGIDADDLRKDDALRMSTKRAVDAVIASLPGLGM